MFPVQFPIYVPVGVQEGGEVRLVTGLGRGP